MKGRLFVLMVASGALPLAAQQAPDAVLRSYFSALAERRWADAAALLHPDAVHFVRRITVQEAFQPARPSRGPTPEMLMANDPAMPREVAEWQAKRYQTRSQPTFEIENRFARVRTVGEILAMPLLEAGARMLEASDPAVQLERAMRQRCPDLGDNIMLRARAGRPAEHVVGAVVRDSVAWAVHETQVPGAAATAMPHASIMELRLTPDGWRIALPPYFGRTVAIPANVPCPAPGLLPPGIPGQRP